MSHVLKYVVIGAVIATGIVLILGIINLFVMKKGHSERSQKLMRLRILVQAIALAVFALLLFLQTGKG